MEGAEEFVFGSEIDVYTNYGMPKPFFEISNLLKFDTILPENRQKMNG